MKYRDLIDRLLANSVPEHTGHTIDGQPSECWLWIGNRDRLGYGRMNLRVGGRHVKARAHRIAAQAFLGIEFTEKDDTWDHECKQPACIHPNHGRPLPNAVNAGKRRNPRR